MAEVIFDEADDEPFFTRDIGMVRRKVVSRKKDESPSLKNEAAIKELPLLKKQLEKQSLVLKELSPTIKRIEDVFKDAIQRMEADSFDDVYQIFEMQQEFKKLNAMIAKSIPKDEPIARDNLAPF